MLGCNGCHPLVRKRIPSVMKCCSEGPGEKDTVTEVFEEGTSLREKFFGRRR